MNTYIILAAGKGRNLQPLTLKYPKTSFRLDEHTTVLQRMVRSIRKHDKNAEIVVVVGYKADEIKKELEDDDTGIKSVADDSDSGTPIDNYSDWD